MMPGAPLVGPADSVEEGSMGGTSLAFAGLALVAGAAALWFRWMRGVRLPRSRLGFVVAWAGGAALGVAGLAAGVGAIGAVAAVVTILGGSVLTGLVAISRQRVGPGAIRVGAMLPAFEAIDEDGGPFRLSELAGRPILLKFFRGHW
jgi:hypothetical protein